MNQIIELTQMPVIKQNLLNIKGQVNSRVETVINMAVTEETRKEAKEVRAALNKERAEFDKQLRDVKSAVMKPYEDLLETYKECITEPYGKADKQLKYSIDALEKALKDEKETEIRNYFDEYAAIKGIDFVNYESVGIKITLNASKKSLKEQAKSYLDKIATDMDSLLSMENTAELFAEYKSNGCDLANAITAVNKRLKSIAEDKAIIAEVEADKKQIDDSIKQANSPKSPLVTEISFNKQYSMSFKVTGTLENLKKLKTFLTEGGYDYERI